MELLYLESWITIDFERDPECYCGYSKSQHLPEALGNQDTNDWKASAHTKTLPTDAYGEIEFMGFSQKISKVCICPSLSGFCESA